jgi:phage/plasmid-like protein (TIGR03299 family)
MIPTTVRVVCQNTLNLALGRAGDSSGVTIYHSERLRDRVQQAREKLGMLTRRFDQFREETRALARRQLSGQELADYFCELVRYRSERQQKKLLESFERNFHDATNTLPGIRGSVWAAYNAVSEYADHQSRVRGQGVKALENRLNSAWFGQANELKQQAFDAALQLAMAV